VSGGTTWESLEQGLADELPELEDRSFLTIFWAPVPMAYVQFEQSGTALTARTGADDVLPADQRLGPAGCTVLETGGWTVPEQDPAGKRTWTMTVGWPAGTEVYERLAARCATVLRDVHGVSSPTELEYRAWREAEPDPEGVTFYPEDLEPAEPHLVLPRLGLHDAQQS
jgi:hypothetical protein